MQGRREAFGHEPIRCVGNISTETADVSTSYYSGDPVYTYSLKQGIEDGFLAPYKVVRIDLDKDLTGWRPEQGKLGDHPS